jgi:hypothetical protein
MLHIISVILINLVKLDIAPPVVGKGPGIFYIICAGNLIITGVGSLHIIMKRTNPFNVPGC